MKYKTLFFLIALNNNINSQTVTIVDHRNGTDTTIKNVNVIDNRIPRNMSPALKPPPSIEEMAVYRIQMRIKPTENITGNPVWVKIDGYNKIYLYKRGGFKPNTWNEFEILNPNIKRVKDLDSIEIGINGDDGMCISGVQLFFNNSGSPVFTWDSIHRVYSCIDSEGFTNRRTFAIKYRHLRSHPSWNFWGPRENMWRPSAKITRQWMTTLIETILGSYFLKPFNEGFDWGSPGNAIKENTLFGPAVEIEYLNDNTLKVDLDLETNGLGPHYEVDIKFEIKFQCIDGFIHMTAQNTKVASKSPMGDIGEIIKRGEKLIDGVIGTDVFTNINSFKLRHVLGYKVPINNYSTETDLPCRSCTKTIVNKAGDVILL